MAKTPTTTGIPKLGQQMYPTGVRYQFPDGHIDSSLGLNDPEPADATHKILDFDGIGGDFIQENIENGVAHYPETSANQPSPNLHRGADGEFQKANFYRKP